MLRACGNQISVVNPAGCGLRDFHSSLALRVTKATNNTHKKTMTQSQSHVTQHEKVRETSEKAGRGFWVLELRLCVLLIIFIFTFLHLPLTFVFGSHVNSMTEEEAEPGVAHTTHATTRDLWRGDNLKYLKI